MQGVEVIAALPDAALVQFGRKGLPNAAGAIPDKKRSSAAARPRWAAQHRTDSFWAMDMISRVKIINGKGAT
jgi:U3 small nucleolar RNA-associated protein 14